jgi:hypothetical protein
MELILDSAKLGLSSSKIRTSFLLIKMLFALGSVVSYIYSVFLLGSILQLSSGLIIFIIFIYHFFRSLIFPIIQSLLTEYVRFITFFCN